MSVIVRGMKMPKTCFQCKWYRDCHTYGICRRECREIPTNTPSIERPDFCPLVEVPDKHGDLIDRDAIIAEYDRQHVGIAGGARKIMVDAPTIIEAEENGS